MHAMMYYHTKFGDPASNSRKDMLWTMFSVKYLETKWLPVCYLCINWKQNLMCIISQLYFNNVPNVNEIVPSNYIEYLSTLSWYVLSQISETKWPPVDHLCLYKKKKMTCIISELYFNYVPNIKEIFPSMCAESLST